MRRCQNNIAKLETNSKRINLFLSSTWLEFLTRYSDKQEERNLYPAKMKMTNRVYAYLSTENGRNFLKNHLRKINL
ncbi:hypothetical protein WA026_002221 [Henosepilachna vigintioctopunctata]|uniref:Uncharacterized protein n=1 Tax=Henosepilachna vigintioctopunctata TaxID=420089 RepID=A0AAW1TZS9_9CUCU